MYNINFKPIAKNNPHTPLKAKGIVIHETATPFATDEAEQRYFNNNNVSASAHAFVDYDSITQCIKWDEVAWHAGYTANNNYIGIELCHFDETNKFKEIWNRGVWLCAYLMFYKLNIKTVNKDNLMSHAEVSNKWHETDHQDPIAYFKNHGKTVDDFRYDVYVEMNKMIALEEAKIEMTKTKIASTEMRPDLFKNNIKGVLDMFNDINDSSDWARPSIERLEGLEIIKGDEHGNFNPHFNITREELIVVIDRVLKLLGK